MATQEEVDRGREAQLLLSNPTYQKAWDDLRADIVSQWIDSQYPQHELRDQCHVAINLLDKLQEKFGEYINAGTIASDIFDKSRKKKVL